MSLQSGGLFNKVCISYSIVDYKDIPENKNNYRGIIISASPKGGDIIQEQLPFYQWIPN